MSLPVSTDPTLPAPHLAVPFGLNADGSAAVVDQDSAEDVSQCVRMLLGTVAGSRIAVPDYGIPDPTFGGVDAAVIEAAVAEWEPRASVTVSIADPPASSLSVTVAVREVQA